MSVLVFGTFELDTRSLELRRDGKKVRLRPQPCLALAMLVTRAGDLVTREELRAALWSDGVHVRYNLGVNSCIKQVRRALGESRTSPGFIETLPRRGYRFTADACLASGSTSEVRPSNTRRGTHVIRITAQVLEAERGTILWTKTTDWTLDDPATTSRTLADAVGAAVSAAIPLVKRSGSTVPDRTVRLVESPPRPRDLALTATRR